MDQLTFSIGPDGDIEWQCPKAAPDITPAQAQVIATLKVAAALEGIGQALDHLAEAVRERGNKSS